MPKKKIIDTWHGIPYSDVTGRLDPHKVYESRARRVVADKSESALGRFAISVFGPSNMASLALALNPYSLIEFPTAKVTPANRTVKFSTTALKRRIQTWRMEDTWCENEPNLSTPFPGDVNPVHCATYTYDSGSWENSPQPALMGFRSDTTKRTRPLTSEGGEFELFVPSASSSPCTVFVETIQESYADPYNTGGKSEFLQVLNLHRKRILSDRGPSLWASQSQLDGLLASERSFFNTLVSKQALGMINDCLPERKSFRGFYNFAELKDLPLMLRKTVELAKIASENPFKGGIDRKLGDQYLNLKFGWESTLKAVRDMLALPTLISNQVNYLISRRGLPTTFRSSRRGIDQVSNPPVMSDNIYGEEFNVRRGTMSRRQYELRCMLNLTLKFPEVDVPILRQDLLDLKWGLYPTPGDVYNLVPWSWLVDWFSGLNKYIDLLDTLHKDRSLFNYGYLTYQSSGNVVTTIDSQTTYHRGIAYLGNPGWGEDKLLSWQRSGTMRFRYQKRIDISSVSGVKTISRPSTLSGGQLAIIGALLTKWAHT